MPLSDEIGQCTLGQPQFAISLNYNTFSNRRECRTNKGWTCRGWEMEDEVVGMIKENKALTVDEILQTVDAVQDIKKHRGMR